MNSKNMGNIQSENKEDQEVPLFDIKVLEDKDLPF